MIAFATLWLGLVAGPLPVTVLVGPEVARVELLLDGATVATLAGPPWATTVDLGPELAPHRLSALAVSADGHPLGEAVQWLDVPRAAAELELALSPGPRGGTVARLAWAAHGGVQPVAVHATLDGTELPLASDGHELAVPVVPPGVVRLLRVEAEFPGNVRVTREVALGAAMSEEVATDLTAVPVEVNARTGGAALLRERDGADLPVLELEDGAGQVVVVLDPACRPALAQLAKQGMRHRMSVGGSARAGTMGAYEVNRAGVPMPRDTTLRMVWPVAEERGTIGMRFDLFPTSPPRDGAEGPLLAQLQVAGALPPPGVRPRLADAVALAALTAAEGGQRRAVVLVLGEPGADASTHAAPLVRRYLERLHVPLLVWSTAKPDAATRAAWGEVEDIGTLSRFESAARRLDVLLGRQRIAWVAGRHLPQQIEAPPASGLRLAVQPPPEETAATATAAEVEADVSEADLADATTAEAAVAVDAPPPQVPEQLPRRPFGAFTLASDVREERLLRALALAAEALPADYAARLGVTPAAAGTVVLFARADDFRRWLTAQGAADPAVEGFARGGVAALAADASSNTVGALLVHELAHLLTRAAGGIDLPAWLDEGIAEDLAMSARDSRGHSRPDSVRVESSTRRISGAYDGKARFEVSLGGPAAALLAIARGTRPTITELVAMPRSSFTAPSGRNLRYATSAFLLRFLLDAETPARRVAFQRYLAGALAGGPADAAALAAALGVAPASLQQPFDLWLRRTAARAATAPR